MSRIFTTCIFDGAEILFLAFLVASFADISPSSFAIPLGVRSSILQQNYIKLVSLWLRLRLNPCITRETIHFPIKKKQHNSQWAIKTQELNGQTCVTSGTVNADDLTVEELNAVAGRRTRTWLTVVGCAVGRWAVETRHASLTVITCRVVLTLATTYMHHQRTQLNSTMRSDIHCGCMMWLEKYIGPVPIYCTVGHPPKCTQP